MPQYLIAWGATHRFLNDDDARNAIRGVTSGHEVTVDVIEVSSQQQMTVTLEPRELPNYQFTDRIPPIQKFGK